MNLGELAGFIVIATTMACFALFVIASLWKGLKGD